MILVDNEDITDARVNLALEEYALRTLFEGESMLLFYINSPSIIIGRNQNTIEEINAATVAARKITVVRRISGGGAVYHDLGNLNFSFIAPYAADRFNRYDQFLAPVVEVLRELGVPAELSGRNDILAGGRKISGNAQFARPDRMFSHGTLLFDSNLDDVTDALQVKASKIESKGVKSIRSRVANITEFLSEQITVVELRERIVERIFGSRDRSAIPMRRLSDADWAAVHELVAAKYGNWSWNYGESPKSNVQHVHRFPAGELDVRIDVEEGRIVSMRIFGDYIGKADVAELEQRMHGATYDRAAIDAAMEGLDVSDYFGDVSREDVVNLIAGF